MVRLCCKWSLAVAVLAREVRTRPVAVSVRFHWQLWVRRILFFVLMSSIIAILMAMLVAYSADDRRSCHG